MGLFNQNNKKTPEEEYQELYDANLAQIEAANYLIRLDFAIGQYGNEDIIAGSMIGSTGKYLMMGKYGDLKWATTTIALRPDHVEIHYNGTNIYYSDILEVRVGDNKGFLNVEKQLILVTRQGNYIFKSETVFIDVISNIIVGSRDRYNDWINDGLITAGETLTDDEWNKLIRGEQFRENNDEDSNVDEANFDRVLRAAELYERGLLSKEEFEEIKNRFMNKKSDKAMKITSQKFCPNCGVEIEIDFKFCTNCGHEL
ncbi:zinc-ribbon domain-containing protein [Methanobrevibacter sp.]|uniref:zinc-ribbon domain-containing protein n=1 Tax=Methanobrevibacter sp. TaxID=66852 RepID=UPI00388CF2FB